MKNPVLQAALEYHERGWSLIPMGNSKKPAVTWGPYQTHRADESQVTEWFGNGSDFGLGVVFGTVSGGLRARDFDKMEAYERWVAANPQLADMLPTVATNRGRHVYFRIASEQEAAIRQSLSKPGGKGAITFDDGELRIGVGCIAKLPPSRHPSGGHYEWLIPPNGEIPLIDVLKAALLKGTVGHRESREDRASRVNGVDRENRECPQDTLSSLCNDPIGRAIANTMPTAFGQRHRLAFEFARELKAMPELADASADDLESYLRRWYDRARSLVCTSYEETLCDFLESWDKVKYPKGDGPVDMLFQRVLETELPEEAERYETPEMKQLVGLCRELQRAAGPDNQFFLACRTGERLLRVSHKTVAIWLRLLRRHGIIKLVECGSAGKRKAHRYRYLKEL